MTLSARKNSSFFTAMIAQQFVAFVTDDVANRVRASLTYLGSAGPEYEGGPHSVYTYSNSLRKLGNDGINEGIVTSGNDA